MSDRETPLTDANVASLTKTPGCFCEADFARGLERKLAEAREVMHAATVLIAAKGRHNTKLAYDGLREALARIDGNIPAHPPTVGCGEGSQAP